MTATIPTVEHEGARPDRTDASVIARSIRYPSTFATIFDRHWPALHSYCSSRAGSAGEDIAAEVFRVAFDDRRRFDGRSSSARPWLFGIAANLLRSHFRGAERGRRAFARSVPVDTTDPTGDAISRMEAQELGPTLAAAIGDLPAKDREALLLLAWTDLRYEDIAQALDIPVGTVRSRISRGRTRVRAHLIAQKDNA